MLATKIVNCTDPYEKMWHLFAFYQNEEVAKNRLFTSYLTLTNEKEAISLAYQNTLKFIYLLKQGVTYFQAVRKNELMVQPLLLYYGMTSLMKALVLIHDPLYPRSTTVLQHGLTTRKKKKHHYLFVEDIVSIQKEGLLPYFSKVVLKNMLETRRKYKLFDLLSLIPELQDTVSLLFKCRTMLKIEVVQSGDDKWKVSFSAEELKGLNIHFSSIYHQIQSSLSLADKKISIRDKENSLLFDTTTLKHAQFVQPLILEDYAGNHYFYYKKTDHMVDNLVSFYLIMYVLGMLSRYDSEQWGEILYSFQSPDLFIIKEFLHIALRKFPNLILNHLYQEKLIFTLLHRR